MGGSVHSYHCCCATCLGQSAEQTHVQSGSAASIGSYILLSDPDTSPATTAIKWGAATLGTQGGAVTWGFYSANANLAMTEAHYQAEVEDAFQDIEAVADIDFQFVGLNANADITIAWDNLGGPGGTIGLTRYGYSTNPSGIAQFTDATVTFDIADYDRNATAQQIENDDFYATAVHEIGHAVGLDHVNDTSQIMNPYLVQGVDMLADGDISGLVALYGAASAIVTLIEGNASGETINQSSITQDLEIFGFGGNDVITAGSGNDQVFGGIGGDFISGGNGADRLIDSHGNDTINGGDNDDRVAAFSGDNLLRGNAGEDIILGGIADDRLFGGSGNDVILGDAFSDTFFGADRIDGGAGDDLLSGGGGADVFVFSPNDDNDTIARITLTDGLSAQATIAGADFQPGVDQVDVTAFGFANANAVLAALSQSGSGAVFDSGGTTITFYQIALADMSIDEFIWV